MYKGKAICIDCGKEFIAKSKQSVRCPDCQREHRKAMDRARKKTYISVEKDNGSAVYRNGHPQVCECVKECFYGGREAMGCNYILETGRLRTKDGYFIENGKCGAYLPKGAKKMKRIRQIKYRKEGAK